MIKSLIFTCITLCLIGINSFYSKAQKTVSNSTNSESKLYEYNYALTEATKYMLFGEYKQAIALYNKCIEVNPESSAPYYELSVIYAKVGDIKTSKVFAQQAFSIDKSNKWYNYQLANIYSYTNNLDSAIAIYENIVKLNPDKYDDIINLASLYYKNNEFEKCKSILFELKIRTGINEQVNLPIYELSLAMKDYALAEAQIKELLEVDQENSKYCGMLAELYAFMGDDSSAVKMYNKMIQYDPDNAIGLFSIADYYRNRGKYQESFNYYKKAYNNDQLGLDQKVGSIIQVIGSLDSTKRFKNDILDLLDILNTKYPSNTKVKTVTIDFLIKNEDYEEALQELKELLAINDEEYFFWEKMILIENYLGRYNDVIKDGNLALNQFKDKPLLYLYIALAYIQNEDNNKAISLLNLGYKYAKEDDEKVQFLSFLGDAYNKIGDYLNSDASFENALKIDSKNLLVLNNYSYYLSLRDEKLDYALKNSKYTIQMDPTNASYLDTYAWILYKLGKYKKAKEYMLLVFKNAEEANSDMYDHYGDILFKLNEKEEALKMYELAIQNGGDKIKLMEKINLARK